MAEAVARVARRINATMEEGRDSLDLSDCGLVSFPDGVFKMMRSCTHNIHTISLANNQIKALSSKFFRTFTQLTELPVEKLSLMPSLKSLDVRCNPLTADSASVPYQFTLLT